MTAAPRCPLQVDSEAGGTRSPDPAVLPANLLSDLVWLLPCLFFLDSVGKSHLPGAGRNHRCMKERLETHHMLILCSFPLTESLQSF